MVILLLIYRYFTVSVAGKHWEIRTNWTETSCIYTHWLQSVNSKTLHFDTPNENQTPKDLHGNLTTCLATRRARARKRNCFKGMLGAPWTQNWTQKRSPTLSDIGTAGLIWKVVTLKIPLVSGTMGLKKMLAGLAIFWNRQIPLFKITVFARVTKTMNT